MKDLFFFTYFYSTSAGRPSVNSAAEKQNSKAEGNIGKQKQNDQLDVEPAISAYTCNGKWITSPSLFWLSKDLHKRSGCSHSNSRPCYHQVQAVRKFASYCCELYCDMICIDLHRCCFFLQKARHMLIHAMQTHIRINKSLGVWRSFLDPFASVRLLSLRKLQVTGKISEVKIGKMLSPHQKKKTLIPWAPWVPSNLLLLHLPFRLHLEFAQKNPLTGLMVQHGNPASFLVLQHTCSW